VQEILVLIPLQFHYLENNFEILREKRNELLKECDYLALPDYPHENPEIRTA
jgi:hypothetical protein